MTDRAQHHDREAAREAYAQRIATAMPGEPDPYDLVPFAEWGLQWIDCAPEGANHLVAPLQDKRGIPMGGVYNENIGASRALREARAKRGLDPNSGRPARNLRFSPANALLHAAKAKCSEVHPGTLGSFARWSTNGEQLWLESSSRSILLTIDFRTAEIRVPTWKAERDSVPASEPIPVEWLTWHAGSLFLPDGSAFDPEAYETARIASPYRNERERAAAS